MIEIRGDKKVLITPISEEDLADIKIGDIVWLDGELMTCRDVAHRRLVEYGRELPYDIKDKAIFHAGPIVRKIEGTEDDYEMVSVGPTTSMRMEKFEYEFTKLTGVRVIVGKGTPTVWWDIVPNSDKCEIYAYMAGGGCTLPGKAMVLMPGAGYEGVTDFVLDQMTSYGLNACPPLLVGVGVGTSVETAALNSKKALMRPIGSHNDNANAAKMEKLLEDGINAIGLGPQGMGGKYSVMGVNIENTARHPSAIGVAVNVGCWSHRRGHIVVNPDLTVTCDTHSTWKFNA